MASLKNCLQKLRLFNKFDSSLLLRGRYNSTMSSKDITFEDLKEKLANKRVILIDVREPNELKETGKIPQSINIPLGDIEKAFTLPGIEFNSKYLIPKPDQTSDDIVLSCKSGKRAAKASEKLATLFQNTFVYKGSFQEWLEKGGTVEKVD